MKKPIMTDPDLPPGVIRVQETTVEVDDEGLASAVDFEIDGELYRLKIEIVGGGIQAGFEKVIRR